MGTKDAKARAGEVAGAEEVAARLRLAITRTARRLRQDALAREASGELSPTLSAMLATIEAHGPLTPSELAEREQVRRPTATRAIGRLVELGLAQRAGDPDDRRSALISATSEARALLRRLRRRKAAYLARMLAGLEAGEVAALDRAAALLEQILERDAA